MCCLKFIKTLLEHQNPADKLKELAGTCGRCFSVNAFQQAYGWQRFRPPRTTAALQYRTAGWFSNDQNAKKFKNWTSSYRKYQYRCIGFYESHAPKIIFAILRTFIRMLAGCSSWRAIDNSWLFEVLNWSLTTIIRSSKKKSKKLTTNWANF